MTKARVNSDCSSMINMRMKSKTDSPIAERIPVGTYVEVSKRNKDWSNINYNGKTGYIMNQFLVFGEKE